VKKRGKNNVPLDYGTNIEQRRRIQDIIFNMDRAYPEFHASRTWHGTEPSLTQDYHPIDWEMGVDGSKRNSVSFRGARLYLFIHEET